MPELENIARLALIRKLSDGNYHSGRQLRQEMGMTRAAILNHVKILRTWGLDVFLVQGKGYCLSSPLDLLDEVRLKVQLNVPDFSLIPVIDSTNQFLLDRIDQLVSGTSCLAEYQESGRGRRGRVWFSPFGTNLYLSIYWRLNTGMAAAVGLSLVVGISMVETLEKLGAKDIKVKWPNDLYWQERKLAGILVETRGQVGDVTHCVIGIGLNVAMTETSEVNQDWINLIKTSSTLPDKNTLAVALINGINETLHEYESTGMKGFVDLWDKYDNFYGKPVKLLLGERKIKGISCGINDKGELLLETEVGITSYIDGEISLRSDL
ncbi:bifunctional biotin--[acetyl-CoA-carboxylase] ligase/biotin operon repressor BirA [Candidatus Enterovibrio escicola]|uniref:Bifunctional ligase/repressor BirA n=1 Tax=Candidatus Enterovibrio escicola TaxID=1927127 RepID=A0A2A5T722_9GAMM|nr:bifunctional biotin--[acetyl-CoA-carboxylase] ligase/biotin operon repressor BirA [Candidatus Enterovibrio escacola]PCS23932.1 Biotin operon repressor [Candidatus Enterovibrio escacola]